MAAQYRELAVLVLDVSPSMKPYLPHLRRAVLTFLHSKLQSTDKQRKETAIVLCGTTATHNPIHSAAVAQDPADVDQYNNIAILENMKITELSMMKSIDDALIKMSEPDRGHPADFVEALIVGWDAMHRSLLENKDREKYPTKRIILVSNFLSQTKDTARDVLDHLSSKLFEFNIAVEAISLDLPADEVDPTVQNIKAQNNELLDILSTQITMKIRSIRYAADLIGVFPVTEVLVSTTYNSTNLCLGEKLKIAVKLSLKAKQEKCPSLGKESPLNRGSDAAGAGAGGGGGGGGEDDEEGASGSKAADEEEEHYGIQKSVEYYREDDKDQLNPIPPEEIIKAFRYGLEVVPMTEEEIKAANYVAPDGGLKILGFTSGDAIPRHYYKKTPLILVANKDAKDSPTAFTALVTAVYKANKLVIMRFAFRGNVYIFMGIPVLPTATAPAYFICNFMPFQEDIRDFKFPTMKKEQRRPSETQLTAALDLVDAMPLHQTPEQMAAAAAAVDFDMLKAENDEDNTKPTISQSSLPPSKEELVPEETANPILNRFVNHFIDKALHEDKVTTLPEPEDDPLLLKILSQTRSEIMPTAETAAAAMKTQFPVGKAANALQKAVRKLRPGQEIEDFITMTEQENYQDAISLMRRHIESIVYGSVGDKRYPDALSALQILREQCKLHHRETAFNQQLMQLKHLFARDAIKSGFWKMACKEKDRVGLITAEEVAASVEEQANVVVEGEPAGGGSSKGSGGGQGKKKLPSKEDAEQWMGCADASQI